MSILTFSPAIVNPAFEALSVRTADDYRPTAGPAFEPSLDDEADYLALVAELEARDEELAEWAMIDRADDEAAAFSDLFDLVNPAELIECGGYHPAQAWE